MLITQIFGKKANFPVKKFFWPNFSRNFEREKPRGSEKKVQGVFRHLMWKLSDHFFGPKGSTETEIFKKKLFSQGQKILARFSSYYRM